MNSQTILITTVPISIILPYFMVHVKEYNTSINSKLKNNHVYLDNTKNVYLCTYNH